MIIFSANGIEKSFGGNLLFSNINLELHDYDKAGLVGINGAGKTTLFGIMTGAVEADKGGVSKKSGVKIGYMEQQVLRGGENSVYEEALTVFSELIQIEKELDEINSKIDDAGNTADSDLISRQMELRERYEAGGGAVYKSRTMSALNGLGFSRLDTEKKADVLSGGEKSKLRLAKLLLSEVNLMFLDEPTNHLDIESAEWLEKFLREYKGSFIVISHDRYFLDKVTNRTLELEHGRLTGYKGNYTEFLNKKEEARAARQKKYDLTVKEIKRIEGIIAQQKRFNQAHNYVTIASKQKSIDRLEETLDKPENEPDALKFKFVSREPSGNDILIIKNLDLTVGAEGVNKKTLFKKACMNIYKKERVFLLGANGSGKSSIFKAILGEYKADGGDIKHGARVEIGYYDQSQSNLNDRLTVIDEIWNEFPKKTQSEIRTALGMFLFKGDDVFKQIEYLSGGERARLSLLKLMMKGSNLLLLDEPTNHLDITSGEALEKALLDYTGTLLIVSHDRYLINKLADKIYDLRGGTLTEYNGNYDYYIERRELNKNNVIEENPITQKENGEDYRKKKERESEERRLAGKIKRAEEKIAALEKEQNEINALLMSDENAGDYQKALELTEKLTEINEKIEKAMIEWDSYVNI